MNNKNSSKWNGLDNFISKWRSKFVFKYLEEDFEVCDIGCGQEGRALVSIKDKIKAGYGFDFKLKKKEIKIDNIKLFRGDFNQIDKKYDLILFLAVLEHLENPDEILKQINSKLKKGGKLILTTPDKRSQWILELMAYKLKIINEEEIRDHKHYFNKKELIEILEKTGFKNIEHKHFQLGLNNLVVCSK